jgi:hypothetical protein
MKTCPIFQKYQKFILFLQISRITNLYVRKTYSQYQKYKKNISFDFKTAKLKTTLLGWTDFKP